MTCENTRCCFPSQDPEHTHEIARALASVLPKDGLVLSLSGDLGAGKTHFVKGLAEGLGLDPAKVTSPTFAIVNEYANEDARDSVRAPSLLHMDFYRLESESALEEVGFLDLLAMGAVLAIEWGDRFPGALPVDRMEIRIDRPNLSSDESDHEDKLLLRTFTVEGGGSVSQDVLNGWQKGIAALRDTRLRGVSSQNED